MRTGGEPLRREWRDRAERPRRLVLLLDVSGSMSAYSRALLVFAHAALARRPPLGGLLLRHAADTAHARARRQPTRTCALRRAAAEVADWDGGTRIGETLKTFLDRHGHGGVARGAVVVLCSDGLEVGDPELLAEQMAATRPPRPQDRLGEPAEGRPGVRAPRARHARGAAVRRPVPQRPQPRLAREHERRAGAGLASRPTFVSCELVLTELRHASRRAAARDHQLPRALLLACSRGCGRGGNSALLGRETGER